MKILVLLTQYKRSNLELQLKALKNQTMTIDYLVVFQNENHIDITKLKKEYNFIHIHSDYNTKFFGRFAACISFPVDICIVMDDDIIPGSNCIKNHVDQCIELNGIIGGNGRIGDLNKNYKQLYKPPDTGLRSSHTLVDFVGHLWCFKKDWLYYMFSIKPLTFDTGEDMHLCFASKLLGNIKSYTAKQDKYEDLSDTYNNQLAIDMHATWRTPCDKIRYTVEEYFIKNYNLELINEQ